MLSSRQSSKKAPRPTGEDAETLTLDEAVALFRMALFRIGNLIELPTHTPRLGLQLSNGACLGLKLLLVARLQSNIDRLSVLLPEVTFLDLVLD